MVLKLNLIVCNRSYMFSGSSDGHMLRKWENLYELVHFVHVFDILYNKNTQFMPNEFWYRKSSEMLIKTKIRDCLVLIEINLL